ncbi:MAG: DPP IV N-terminal domain-containing protein [Bacteroides sp.]
MYKRIYSFLVLCMVLGGGAMSQRDLTMEEAVLRKSDSGSLSPATLTQFHWIPSRDAYSYLSGDTLRIVSSEQQQDYVFDTFRPKFEAAKAVLNSWSGYRWISGREIELWAGTQQYLIDLDDAKIRTGWQLPSEAENLHFAPEGRALSYNIEESIIALDAKGNHYEVANYAEAGIRHGRAVHRNEFGIEKGIFWSPKGRHVAYYHLDERMVTEYPLVDISTEPASLKSIRYPMAGGITHKVMIGVYSLDTKRSVWLETEMSSDQYFTNIAWSPDARYLYVAEVNRAQDTMHLNRYDVTTGKLDKTLFEETSPHYVEPLVPVQFLPGDPKHFIWQSQRSGHNHLYLYNTDGKLERTLTSGEWEVLEVIDFSVDGSKLFIASNENDVLGRQLYQVDLKSNKRTRISPKEGYNRFVLDVVGERYASFWTSFDNPGGVYIGSLKSPSSVKDLLVAPNPLQGYNIPNAKLVELTAADGRTKLYGRLFTPKDATTSGKKYPVVVYVYGGPHAQLVTNSWMGGAPYWELLMAERGYVVFVMDNRGSANRGYAFEQVIHRNLGEAELADQKEGVKYLKTLPFVDTHRMGVHGWSFGGFMSMSMLLRFGDTFKVAVSGGPVINWRLYEIMYGERYMDTPAENPEGYARADLRQYVKNLEGKHLLMLHGYQDDVVVPQHTLSFLKACVDNRITGVDCFFYPGHPHNVRGKDRVHLMQKVTEYFDEYLKR